jgi:hypothetical protein
LREQDENYVAYSSDEMAIFQTLSVVTRANPTRRWGNGGAGCAAVRIVRGAKVPPLGQFRRVRLDENYS